MSAPKTKKSKKEKEEEQPLIFSCSNEEYVLAVEQGLVHFSTKTVNSNAQAGGVRITKDQALDLPYVSLRTLISQTEIALDYFEGANSKIPGVSIATATVVKELRPLYEKPTSELTHDEAQRLSLCRQAASIPLNKGIEEVDERLRQVLLPKKDGNYLSMTPLGCAGFSEELQAREKILRGTEQSEEEKTEESAKRIRAFERAHLGFGGANPQNVGAYIREMQRPLFFKAPTESLELRRALRLHFSGVVLNPSRKLMERYRDWLMAVRRSNSQAKDHIPFSNLRRREEEKRLVLNIVNDILHRCEKARADLENFRDSLPLPQENPNQLLSIHFKDEVVIGLIEPSRRERDWPQKFALMVANQIRNFRFADNESMQFDDNARDQLAQWIEEEVGA